MIPSDSQMHFVMQKSLMLTIQWNAKIYGKYFDVFTMHCRRCRLIAFHMAH